MDLEAIVGEAQELLPSMAISPEASHLLQGYYVMSRRIRGASASINRQCVSLPRSPIFLLDINFNYPCH